MDRLELTLKELKQCSRSGGRTRNWMAMAMAMRTEQPVIVASLEKDAVRILPRRSGWWSFGQSPAVSAGLAQGSALREGTSVDAVLTRELEGVASAYRNELVGVVPELAPALAWPEEAGGWAN